ncbi:hypothetical protein GCM10022224_082590 [Nonomuraea antimicrobica]|uniref:Transposase DDE domain-containing protein n=1 Tax=Nonomuraea antimicrobica TaxID=561173 RepID=A0ABP7DHD0_9ACTN
MKRHLLVDTFGAVVTACVSPASVNDRNGAVVLLASVSPWESFLYRGLSRRFCRLWVLLV